MLKNGIDKSPKVTFSKSILVLTYLKCVFGLHIGNYGMKSSFKCLPGIFKKFSLFWLFYSLVLLCLYMFYFIQSISFSNIKVSILDYGVEVMFTSAGVTCMIVTLVWSIKNTKKLYELKKAMEKFDDRFKMFGRNIDNVKMQYFAICELAVVALFWSFYFSYYVFWNCSLSSVKCMKNLFTIYHPHKILMVAFLEELAFLYGLNLRFKCLNEVLLSIGSDPFVLDSRWINPRVKIVAAASRVHSSSKMVHCRELHYFLCDICADMNDAFSLQTVANILDCFVNIFVSLYLVCFGYSRDVENSGTVQNPMGIFLPLCLGIEAFSKIFCLAKYCESVQSEAHNTGAIIHKISLYSVNDDFVNEISRFSHQLLHKNVQITACGMFPIDYSLIYNIISAVTTFLVILIQFALAINYNQVSDVDTSIVDESLVDKSSSTNYKSYF